MYIILGQSNSRFDSRSKPHKSLGLQVPTCKLHCATTKVRTYKAMNIDYEHQTSWFMNNKKKSNEFQQKKFNIHKLNSRFCCPIMHNATTLGPQKRIWP
jgi:hypothetical protein